MSTKPIHVNRHQRYLRFTITGAQAKGYGFSSKAVDTRITYDRKNKMFIAVGGTLKDKHERELAETKAADDFIASYRDKRGLSGEERKQMQFDAEHEENVRLNAPVGKKTRPQSNPYRIYKAGEWEWRVLKSYQNDDTKPNARWFLAVKSPMTYGTYELGDGYVADIVGHGELVKVNP